jgi:hypothetical protein
LVLLLALSAPAGAVIWGPITISQLQDPNTPPDPTPPDTLGPMAGIITGFDNFPTGFCFYLQSSQGGPWTGVDIFTGGTNQQAAMGLALGDSIVIEGRAQEYQGETEVTAKDGDFGTNMVITKVSSGNPLPPIYVGTVAQLQELPTNPLAEQWEGCLVRVNGPMRIVRTNVTGGLGTFRAALVVDDNVCPITTPPGTICDSMFIDLSTLANPAINPPAPPTVVDFAQGIYSQRTRGYRIQVRDAGDWGVPAPPALVRSYFTGKDTVRVVLDRDVTQASAEDESNYELASVGSTVDLATQVAGNVVDLRVTEALSPGQRDSLTVTGLVSSSSGLTMTAQGQAFYVAVVTPAEIQAPDPVALGGAPCVDQTKYLTVPVTARGICTAKFGNIYYLQGVAGGLRNGVAVYAPPVPMVPGRQYVVSGVMVEYYRETEYNTVYYVRDEGASTIAAPILQSVAVLADSTCDASQSITSGEDYEGVRVRVQGVKVIDDAPAGGYFRVVGPAPSYPDTIYVEDGGSNYTFDSVPDQYLNVNGILRFSFDRFRIYPASDADITLLGMVDVAGLDRGRVDLRTWPNPASTFNVAFNLPRADRVKLAVYDLAGRQVALLAEGNLQAGVHRLTWDGRSADGTRARSGIYFYRLLVGNEERLQKVVRLQ